MRGRFGGLVRLLPVGVVVAALAIAGCSGNGSTGPAPAVTPAIAGASVIPPGGGPIAALTVDGLTATLLTGPGATPNTLITLNSSASAPANALAPSSVRRTASIAGAATLLYVTMTLSQTTPASVFTGQTLALTTAPSDVTYFEEIDDTTTAPGTKLATFQGSQSGSLVTFSSGFPGSAAFLTGHTYTFMYYTTPGLPSPTPAPTSTASGLSPSPSPAPTSTGPAPTPTPTPGPTSAATLVAAGTFASIAIPAAGNFTGTAQFAGFNVDSTVTLNSVAALPPGVPSPTSGTVFFAESVAASPAVTFSSANCVGCQTAVPLSINVTLNLKSDATGKTFYVAECSPTACPRAPGDAVPITINGAALQVQASTFADLTAYGPTPTWFVFYYQ